LSLGPLARIELACQDPQRQRDFYARLLGITPGSTMGAPLRFVLGGVELVLRQRGDVLFPLSTGDAGMLLAFSVPDAELERWHRRMLMARIAVLDAPGPAGAPPRCLRVADPEGNVIEIFSAS
jgi:catechol 2,3-dioxygenase-like lactoylglutathione lyase family enzyme